MFTCTPKWYNFNLIVRGSKSTTSLYLLRLQNKFIHCTLGDNFLAEFYLHERRSLLLQVHLCTFVTGLWTASQLHGSDKDSCRWTLRHFFFLFWPLHSSDSFTRANGYMQLADPLVGRELQRPVLSKTTVKHSSEAFPAAVWHLAL